MFDRPNLSKPINFERLREAYAIIDGIPQEAFDLDAVVTKSDGNLKCGTIACAAGWLMIHPKFARILKTKLSVDQDDPTDSYVDSDLNEDYDQAMMRLFNMNRDEVMQLFSFRNHSDGYVPDTEELSDKEVWKTRVRNFLVKKGRRIRAQ
ncbi:hypothetical protein [Cupriavidus campinensis]|uniref:Uncharacterized protein n=1 Tax=Cupriavidus campinensis TaxID=151783 RepID=A0ABY3ET35_9BURK|nr:hypothetical protein [Cupriavidus campinensis]TSP14014.1 hypothetical protein FGG12_05965 [Cupriavidus campinensis]